ncbi:MAG: hypothetical protein IKN62_03770 [Elusimicrobia bacterium]|nr:hypothetical protein [Elusimicrobiota bacterium]
MKNLTSVQAMYISHKRELQTLTNRIDMLDERDTIPEDDILFDSLIDEYNRIYAQLEILELILDDDVPEVKGGMK